MRTLVVMSLVCLGLAIGCSKDSDGPSSPGAEGGAGGAGAASASGGALGVGGETQSSELPEGLLEFCEASQAYMCSWGTQCGVLPDCSGDVPFLASLCTPALLEAVTQGAYVFDQELASTCLPKDVVCADYPRWVFEFSCKGVLTGTTNEGGSCLQGVGSLLVSNDCKAGACEPNESCDFTCSPETRPALGESCDGSCLSPAICSEGKCVKLPAIGESCTQVSCENGITCNADSVCVAPSGLGQACDTKAPCANSMICSNGKCSTAVKEGEACSSAGQCPAGTTCYSVDGGMTRTCQSALLENDACPNGGCDDKLGLLCMDPDPNDVSTDPYCIHLGRAGEGCEPYGCDSNHWCRYTDAEPGGICTARGGPGDTCQSHAGTWFEKPYACASTATEYVCVDDECRERGNVGDPCDPQQRASCLAGLTCSDAAKCASPRALGESCNPLFEAAACEEGAFCSDDSNKCVTAKKDDALCDAEWQCQAGGCVYQESDDTYRCGFSTNSCY